jgi:hypothetical protein
MNERAAGMAELDICMMPEEVDLLREASRNRHHVIEFGCGGSTILFLGNAVEALDSVESDKAWAAKVCAEPSAAAALRSGRFRMHHVDIGHTKAWGYPVDDAAKALWPRYPRAIWRNLESPAVDFVFIDGRFRVACALVALLPIRPPALIAVHDFWTRPKVYGELLEFLDVVHRVESLGIFAPRGDIDKTRVKKLLGEYLTDPR